MAYQLGTSPGLEHCHPALLDDASGKVCIEYVWVGTAGALRSKTKVLDSKPLSVEEVPVITAESENTYGGQAWAENNQEVFLKPRKLFRDPFRGGDHLLVLCDSFMPPQVDLAKPMAPLPPLQPHPTNLRVPTENVMKVAQASAPAFAAEQEFTIQAPAETGSWPHAHLPDPTKPFLYGPQGTVAQTIPTIGGVAAARAARQLSEAHLKHCLHAGIRISGASQSPSPNVWSYKLGPCSGVDLGDQLWMSRHVLLRVAEAMGVPISFDPSLAGKGVSGMGCYIKYSTEETRKPGIGLVAIQQHVGRLQATHMQHIMAYGKGSLQRVMSKASSSSQSAVSSFTCGFGNKAAMVVVPTTTMVRRSGYYVDRRPASNVDPYAVTMLLVSTTLGVPLPCTIGAPAAGAPAAKVSLPQHHSLRSALSNGSVCGGSIFSWGCSSKATSLNTEDVLIDELDRMDGMAPDTPPNHGFSLTSALESCDECTSDGTSPETRGPLSSACTEEMCL